MGNYLQASAKLPQADRTRDVEGIDNIVKVIVRRAYGYRDEDDFLLNIRAAFSSIPR